MTNLVIDNDLETQTIINNITAGIHWVDGIASNGNKIRWKLCMQMETAELIDSLNWKHWKKEELDVDNALMELVDIYHFWLSEFITYTTGANMDVSKYTLNIPEKTNETPLELAIRLSSLIHKYETDAKLDSLFKIMDTVFLTVQALGFTINDFHKIFKLKNAINILRQQNGYKEGTYLKIWNLGTNAEKPIEDNEYITKYYSQNDLSTKTVQDIVEEITGIYTVIIRNS